MVFKSRYKIDQSNIVVFLSMFVWLNVSISNLFFLQRKLWQTETTTLLLTGNLLDRLQGHQKNIVVTSHTKIATFLIVRKRSNEWKSSKIIWSKTKTQISPRYQKVENKWPFNWKENLSADDNYVKKQSFDP
jgi:hypothetical protein